MSLSATFNTDSWFLIELRHPYYINKYVIFNKEECQIEWWELTFDIVLQHTIIFLYLFDYLHVHVIKK